MSDRKTAGCKLGSNDYGKKLRVRKCGVEKYARQPRLDRLTLGIKRRRTSKKNGLLWQKVRSINETSISVYHEDDAGDESTPHDITLGLVASS